MRREGPKPHYHHAPSVVAAAACSLLLGRRRSVSADAEALLAHVHPAPRVEGQEHIPAHGPFLVVVNHYSRPGLDAWWGPLLIHLTVSRRRPGAELRWPMASAWTYPPEDLLGNWVLAPLSRWLFPRIARTYALVSMPPMPPRPHEVVDRVRATRELLALARDPRALIAVAPEGRDSPHGGLVTPPPGVGRLILQLTRAGRPILPVGVAEREGALTAKFGRVFALDVERGGDKDALDEAVSTQVMVAIGRLLPPEMWGEYARKIGTETSEVSQAASRSGDDVDEDAKLGVVQDVNDLYLVR